MHNITRTLSIANFMHQFLYNIIIVTRNYFFAWKCWSLTDFSYGDSDYAWLHLTWDNDPSQTIHKEHLILWFLWHTQYGSSHASHFCSSSCIIGERIIQEKSESIIVWVMACNSIHFNWHNCSPISKRLWASCCSSYSTKNCYCWETDKQNPFESRHSPKAVDTTKAHWMANMSSNI